MTELHNTVIIESMQMPNSDPLTASDANKRNSLTRAHRGPTEALQSKTAGIVVNTVSDNHGIIAGSVYARDVLIFNGCDALGVDALQLVAIYKALPASDRARLMIYADEMARSKEGKEAE